VSEEKCWMVARAERDVRCVSKTEFNSMNLRVESLTGGRGAPAKPRLSPMWKDNVTHGRAAGASQWTTPRCPRSCAAVEKLRSTTTVEDRIKVHKDFVNSVETARHAPEI